MSASITTVGADQSISPSDGSRVHLLSVFHVGEGRTLAQREVEAKTNEIPELAPAVAGLDLAGMVLTLDALHTQREHAQFLVTKKKAHYILAVKNPARCQRQTPG